jgi:hypothetical protein
LLQSGQPERTTEGLSETRKRGSLSAAPLPGVAWGKVESGIGSSISPARSVGVNVAIGDDGYVVGIALTAAVIGSSANPVPADFDRPDTMRGSAVALISEAVSDVGIDRVTSTVVARVIAVVVVAVAFREARSCVGIRGKSDQSHSSDCERKKEFFHGIRGLEWIRQSAAS